MVNWALQPDKKDGDGALTDMDYPVYPPSLYRCPPHISFSCLPLHSPAAVSPDVLEHTTCIQRCKLGGPPESDRDRCVPRPIRSELVNSTARRHQRRWPCSRPCLPPWTEPTLDRTCGQTCCRRGNRIAFAGAPQACSPEGTLPPRVKANSNL